MFDVIGKRRWFFLFSALLTIPGLIFILLGPITNGTVGLQFSIDYTGGTSWEIKFQDPTVGADQIKTALARQGISDATVIATSDGFFEIRSRQVALPPPAAPSPSPSAGASASPGSSASAGASASPAPGASASAGASAAASPSASSAASRERIGVGRAVGLAGRVGRRQPGYVAGSVGQPRNRWSQPADDRQVRRGGSRASRMS